MRIKKITRNSGSISIKTILQVIRIVKVIVKNAKEKLQKRNLKENLKLFSERIQFVLYLQLQKALLLRYTMEIQLL